MLIDDERTKPPLMRPFFGLGGGGVETYKHGGRLKVKIYICFIKTPYELLHLSIHDSPKYLLVHSSQISIAQTVLLSKLF
jgi:hypothetical protein